MNKFVSLAVLALLGDAAAIRHHHKHHHRHHHPKQFVQFIDGDFDDDEQMVQRNVMGAPVAVPIGTLLQSQADAFSDPIHGSLGEPKIPMADLNPDQQFEQRQRNMKPLDLKPEKETVDVTENSIKVAEGLTGAKMAEPTDPKQLKKVEPPVQYYHHDAADEDEDTVETRRSVKTVEKTMQQRFFINERERKDYERAASEGRITDKELKFAEDEDHEIGQSPDDELKAASKEAEKKKQLVADKAEAEEKKAVEAKMTPKEKKEAAAVKAAEEADAAAKAPSGNDKPADAFVPPELAGTAAAAAPAEGEAFVPPELAGTAAAAPAAF